MKENKEIWFCVNEEYIDHGKGDSPEEAFDNLCESTGCFMEVTVCTFYKAQEVKMKMKIVEYKEGE